MRADPIGAVRGLYAWLGEPVTGEFESGMRRWWAANAENREPSAQRAAAAFGLDVDRIRPRFAGYVERANAWTAHGPTGR
jgi:hypothetical protein